MALFAFLYSEESYDCNESCGNPSAIREKNPNQLPADMVSLCEQMIDNLTSQMEDNGYFILPGGTPVSAQLQFARVVCRRAERRLWSLNRQDSLPQQILCYINRLSDLFFIMSRYEMWQQRLPEERWMSFAYKAKKQR